MMAANIGVGLILSGLATALSTFCLPDLPSRTFGRVVKGGVLAVVVGTVTLVAAVMRWLPS